MKRLVIIGDALLDLDIAGRATRLVPDEAAPVIDTTERSARPGGAGLAAMMLAGRPDTEVQLITGFGDDEPGRLLADLLASRLTIRRMPFTGRTVSKCRVRVGGRTIARIDDGSGTVAPAALPTAVSDAVLAADGILVSDYGRGAARHPAVRRLLTSLADRVPIVWDPHPRGPEPVPGCALVTPNLEEARGLLTALRRDHPVGHRDDHQDGSRLDHRADGHGDRLWDHLVDHAARHRADHDVDHAAGDGAGPGVDQHGLHRDGHQDGHRGDGEVDLRCLAAALRDHWRSDAVAITLGSGGAALRHPHDELTVIPVPRRAASAPGADACGAGDRFSSSILGGLVRGRSLLDAVTTAVEDAALFVAGGAAETYNTPIPDRLLGPGIASTTGIQRIQPRAERPTPYQIADEVRRRGGRLVATGGCFDLVHPGHLELLRRARALGDALVVCINSDSSVRQLKGPSRPIVPEQDRARLLAELEPVDATVIFDEPDPSVVLSRLRPDIWVKGDDHATSRMPEASVVREHGGRIVLIPTLDGYSTTRIVEHMVSRS